MSTSSHTRSAAVLLPVLCCRSAIHACIQSRSLACTNTYSIAEFVSLLAQQLKLGKNGIEEYLPLGELSAYEQKAMDEAVTILQVLL